MAQIWSGKSVITIQNEYNGTTVFESGHVAVSSTDKGKTYQLVTSGAKQSSEPWAGASKEPQKPSAEDQQELKRQQHADTIVGALKDLETSKINAVAKRAKVEAEIAAQERAEKTALMFVVHGAIQAGIDLDDVVQDMRDDYAGYVSDMYDQVYVATDLDTVVNV